MTIDHDALALEVAKDFTSDISTHNSLIDFARRYRAALAEQMEPVVVTYEYGTDREEPLYSLDGWK